MSSVSVLGTSQITLQFRLDRNIDAAAQDVQAAISSATRFLPTNMPSPLQRCAKSIRRKPLSSRSPRIFDDLLAHCRRRICRDRLHARNLNPLTVHRHVSTFFGQFHPAVRIQVDPNELAARGIGIDEVAAAVRSANVDLATGTLNGPRTSALMIEAEGQLTKASDYLHANPRLPRRGAGSFCRRRYGHPRQHRRTSWPSSSYNGKAKSPSALTGSRGPIRSLSSTPLPSRPGCRP